MSKVLVFIDWYTPAFKAGGPIRSVRNLIEATGNDHEYHIITGNKDFAEPEKLNGIKENVWQNVGKAQVCYLPNENISGDRYKELYSEVKPDFIYLNSLFSAKFTLLPLRTFKNQKDKIVLAPRGMLGEESLKIKPLKKRVFIAVSKLIGLYKGVKWHCTNAFEKGQVENKFGKNSIISIAPNLPFVTSEWQETLDKEVGSLRMLMVSRIVPIKNIKFLLQALQYIKCRLTLQIIGPLEDEEYWRNCQLDIADLPDTIQIDYLGEMTPDKINDFYLHNHVYCSPTLNENYGHSIVEALGFGCPVILSQNTPWRDLEKIGVGFDLPFVDKQFAKAIDHYGFMDADTLNVARKKSREYAKNELLNEHLLTMSKQLFLP